MLRHVAQLAAELTDQFGLDAHQEAVRRCNDAITASRYKDANEWLLVAAAVEEAVRNPSILRKRRFADVGGTPRKGV